MILVFEWRYISLLGSERWSHLTYTAAGTRDIHCSCSLVLNGISIYLVRPCTIKLGQTSTCSTTEGNCCPLITTRRVYKYKTAVLHASCNNDRIYFLKRCHCWSFALFTHCFSFSCCSFMILLVSSATLFWCINSCLSSSLRASTARRSSSDMNSSLPWESDNDKRKPSGKDTL